MFNNESLVAAVKAPAGQGPKARGVVHASGGHVALAENVVAAEAAKASGTP